MSYANCGLPYYVGGVIDGPREAHAADPRELPAPASDIDVRVRHEAVSIDRTAKVGAPARRR